MKFSLYYYYYFLKSMKSQSIGIEESGESSKQTHHYMQTDQP